MEFFADLGFALASLVVAFVVGSLILIAYNVLTPTFNLWKEVEKGNLAVAMSLGGQMIGAGLVLLSAILHKHIFEVVLWSLIGGVLQISGFLIFDLVLRGLAVGRELGQDNRAVGFVAMSVGITIGLVVAGCISDDYTVAVVR